MLDTLACCLDERKVNRIVDRRIIWLITKWLKVLRRRSQKDHFTWERLNRLIEAKWEPVRILHSWLGKRCCQISEVGAVCVNNAHVRICAGGGVRGNSHSYRHKSLRSAAGHWH